MPTPSPSARRRALTAFRADVWAQDLELKVGGRLFTTKGRRYLISPLRDKSDEIVIKKAAQLGFTLGVIIKTLHKVVELRQHGLYLLPFKQGSTTFVQGKIDPVIDSNKNLKAHFAKGVENKSHKQTTDAVNLYIRGTNIATELVEIGVDFEVWDERDKFVEKWLDNAIARMDGSEVGQLIQLSTPTAPGVGIDSEDNWRSSDQCKWEVPCPHCSRYQVLTFEDNVKLGDSYLDCVLECSYCHKKITDRQRWEINDKGRWSPTYLNSSKRGYHISQFNSPVKRFQKLVKAWFDGQSDSVKLRGFYNLGLGEPYAGSGDKFTTTILDDCILRGHMLRLIPQGPIFVGVDVGNFLHMKASFVVRDNRKVMWDAKIFKSFNDLDKYLSSLHNFNCVIDVQPEKTKAKELVEKYPRKVWLGREVDNPDQSEVAVFNEKDGTVTIDRTMALDQYITNHMKGLYKFPMNARELGEDYPRKDYGGFYAHHLEMVRTYVEDAKGRTVVRWQKTKNPDHWHHAGMFESIAMLKPPPLAVPASVARAFQRAGNMVRR